MHDPRKIRPVGPYVLVKSLKKETERKSGVILLQETLEDKVGFVWAEVIRVGSGEYDEKQHCRIRPGVEPGEVVLIRRYLAEVTQLPQSWFLEDHFGFVHQRDLIGVRDEPFELTVTRI